MISEQARHNLVIEQLEKAYAQAALDAAVLRGDRTPSGPRLTVASFVETIRRLTGWLTQAATRSER